MDGAALFNRLRALDPDLPVVIVTGHGDLPTAVSLMREGAYDFITKPFSAERLAPTLRRALEKRSLVLENRRLREAADDGGELGLIGTSAAVADVRAALRRLAPLDMTVLLTGETGTGKSLCAGILHRLGRSGQPLVRVECGALGDDGAAELLGHASGGPTSASLPRSGVLRRGQRGTVVFEGVERLPAALHPVLETVLDTGTITALGSDTALPLEARIVATADAALPQAVAAGDFPRSLYHRLAAATIELPALRAREDDAMALFGEFLRDAVAATGAPLPDMSADLLARLRTHGWPGNVREVRALAGEVARGVTATPTPDHPGEEASLRSAVARYEAEYIRAALAEARGDVEAARARLDLPRKTLYDKMARHGLVAASFRARGEAR
jgi:two-component system C4-dicarboxylate transport response regulator DctD